LIVFLLGATVWGLARRSGSAFAFAWFFLILAPTSSVLPIITEVAAEHRLYLPVAGIIALMVLGLFDLGGRLAARIPAKGRPSLAPTGLIAAAVVVALFARMTYARNTDYQNYDRIWSDTIAKRPHNTRARNNYATSLLAQGRFSEAEGHLRVAVEEKPSFSGAHANLGVALSAQGKLEEGAQHLRRALELTPDYPEAHRNLGETYALQHRLGEAVAQYSEALQSLPDDVSLLNRIAWILATADRDEVRDGERARALAERAVQLTSRKDPVSLDALGAAFAELGQFDAAVAAISEALVLSQRAGDTSPSNDLESKLRAYSRKQPTREP
jgi:tetratricopeptide (TPR) repeat protein